MISLSYIFQKPFCTRIKSKKIHIKLIYQTRQKEKKRNKERNLNTCKTLYIIKILKTLENGNIYGTTNL